MKLKSIILCLSIAANANIAIASVSSDLGNFFNSMGYDQNITDPHAYQGQAAGYYTGGSIFLRNGVRNIQVMQIDTPSYRAGCGGIDLFFGGMSFIKSEQLIEFFKETMQNAPGYLFNLALQTEVPEIAHTLEVAQDWAQKMNSQNLSSCELAEDLVGGLVPQNAQAQRKVCADVGTQDNVFSDWTEARLKCGKGNEFDDQIKKAANDPANKANVTANTNLVWNELMENNFLKTDRELAEFFMSVSGSIIFDSETQKITVLRSLLSPELINALMYGGEMPIYHCNDQSCLKVMLEPQKITINSVKALVNQVTLILQAIQDKSAKGTPGLTTEEMGFIASTRLPIFKLITVSTEAGYGLDVSSYAEVISYDLLSHYLSDILTVIKNTNFQAKNYSPGIEAELMMYINQAQQYIEHMESESYKKVENTLLLVEQSRTVEREVASTVSSQTKDNLSFSGS